MKVQINTEEKTIKIQDEVMLNDFFETIKKILPDWKDYKLEIDTITNWTNPIVIKEPYRPYYISCKDSIDTTPEVIFSLAVE